MATYAFIDVSHKQEFIYKHNKLRDNLYNSFIIKCVTELLRKPPKESISLSQYLTEHFKEEAEFVYSGGGNSIVSFTTRVQAENFVRTYSREILRAYPDLELYISLVDDNDHEITSICGEDREKKIRELLHLRADKLKDKRRAKFRRWTYGVEQIDETGHAKQFGEEKRDYELSKNYLFQSLQKELEFYNKTETLNTSIGITDELHDYRKGEDGKSYIGVIVIDGNKMGEMASRISTFDRLKEFSETIERLYSKAVSTALLTYAESDSRRKQGDKLQKILVTPIVMAGDDICLIVEAEHAIELATEIVKKIRGLSIENDEYRNALHKLMDKDQQTYQYLTACAGVAIVKYSYPFFEAVRTAEALCHRAKESMHKVKTEDGKAPNASFIDWEIVQGQVDSDYSYEDYVKHGQYKERFHLKPLRIDQEEPVKDGVFSYRAFIELVQKINEGRKDKMISNTVLEKVKRVIYSGWEQYHLFFETKQTEGCERIVQIAQEIFGDRDTRYAALVAENKQSKVYTYVLNDVLDALSFISAGQEEETNVT